MKKWFLAIALFCIAGSIYLLLSAKPSITKTVTVKANISAASRCLLNTADWAKWWPKQYSYRIQGVFYNEVRLLFQGRGKEEVPVKLRMGQLNQDSILLGWEGDIRGDERASMDTLLSAFRTFVEDAKNIYGVRFMRTLSRDSTLITITSIEVANPTTDYIYRKIDTLRAYAASEGARVINFPMMNVTQLDARQVKIMIALSLDRSLAGNSRIVIKRFVPWKMIEGEVQGGDHLVRTALRQLYIFRDDNRLSIMALPFQSLVTDRRSVPDSTKWVTRVCAPIS